jgi:hypothetical protein
MVEQLIWIELLVKLSGGVLLIALPRTFARLIGLPTPTELFWARLLGGVLIGLALASLLESHFLQRRGIGLAGHIVINLTVAFTLAGLLILGQAGRTRRGKVLLSIFIAFLVVLSLVELAWTGISAVSSGG